MTAKTLLISDVDHTLLGDDAATARFADWCARRREEFVLAYASGRFCESVAQSVRSAGLPAPDYLIGGVGTQLRCYPGGKPIAEWEEPPPPRWDALKIRSLLKGLPQLEPQPLEFQSDRKISYFFYDAHAADIQRVRDLLLDAGLRVDVIYSSQRDLDIVPAGVNKGSAAAFLARKVAPACGPVIVCGDSGNDLPLFLQGFWGVVVANGHRELKELAGERVYVSPFSYADGVLDGLRYWLKRPRLLSQ